MDKTVKKPFDNAAAPDAFDFARAVEETYALFLAARNKIFFVKVERDKAGIVHPDPAAIKALENIPGLAYWCADQMNSSRAGKKSFYKAYGGEKKFVFLYAGSDRDMQGGLASDLRFIWNHELGHALDPAAATPDAKDCEINYASYETLASAFAVLMHLKNNPGDTATIAHMAKIAEGAGRWDELLGGHRRVLEDPALVQRLPRMTGEEIFILAKQIMQETAPPQPGSRYESYCRPNFSRPAF